MDMCANGSEGHVGAEQRGQGRCAKRRGDDGKYFIQRDKFLDLRGMNDGLQDGYITVMCGSSASASSSSWCTSSVLLPWYSWKICVIFAATEVTGAMEGVCWPTNDGDAEVAAEHRIAHAVRFDRRHCCGLISLIHHRIHATHHW